MGCREEVGLTDEHGGEVLTDTIEANEMNGTKREKGGSPGQAGSGVGWKGGKFQSFFVV